MSRREEIIERIVSERARHSNLPGSEGDVEKTPNDWVATIISYLGEATDRNGNAPTRENFEDGLVKAGAILLAAMEFCNLMQINKAFR